MSSHHNAHTGAPVGGQRYRDGLTTQRTKVHQSLTSLHRLDDPNRPAPPPQQAQPFWKGLPKGAEERGDIRRSLGSVAVGSNQVGPRRPVVPPVSAHGGGGGRYHRASISSPPVAGHGYHHHHRPESASHELPAPLPGESLPPVAQAPPSSNLPDSVRQARRMQPSLARSLDALTATRVGGGAASGAPRRASIVPDAKRSAGTKTPTTHHHSAVTPNRSRRGSVTRPLGWSPGDRIGDPDSAMDDAQLVELDREVAMAVAGSSLHAVPPAGSRHEVHSSHESALPQRLVAAATSALVEDQLRAAVAAHVQQQQQRLHQHQHQRHGSNDSSSSRSGRDGDGGSDTDEDRGRGRSGFLTPVATTVKLLPHPANTRAMLGDQSPLPVRPPSSSSVHAVSAAPITRNAHAVLPQPGDARARSNNNKTPQPTSSSRSATSMSSLVVTGSRSRRSSLKAPGTGADGGRQRRGSVKREGSPIVPFVTKSLDSVASPGKSGTKSPVDGEGGGGGSTGQMSKSVRFLGGSQSGLLSHDQEHVGSEHGGIQQADGTAVAATALGLETSSRPASAGNAGASMSAVAAEPSSAQDSGASPTTPGDGSSTTGAPAAPAALTKKPSVEQLEHDDSPYPLGARDDPPDMYDRVVYPPTFHQQYLYSCQFPAADENHPNPTGRALPVHIAAFRITSPTIHMELLASSLGRAARAHRIFHSALDRNSRIVDADVDACVQVPPPLQAAGAVASAAAITRNDPQVRVLPTGLDPDDALVIVQDAASGMSSSGGPARAQIGQGWRVFLHSQQPGETRVYAVVSPLIGDARSADLLVALGWRTYTMAVTRGFAAASWAAIPPTAITGMSEAKRWACEREFPVVCARPSMDFVDFAEDEAAALSTSSGAAKRDAAIVGFKAQVFESRQEYVDLSRKAHLEKEMARLEGERRAKERQIQSIITRIAGLEMDLSQVEAAHAKLAAAASVAAASGKVTVIRDDHGGVLEMTEEVRETVYRSILSDGGSGVPVAGLRGLLDRQGVDPTVSVKLEALAIEVFAELTESEVMQAYGIVGREKRKVLALIEHVRNRIKDGIQEHAKLKYDLEKKTLRLRREVTTQRALLKSSMADVDRLAHVHLQYKNLVHPPLVFTLTPSACLDARLGDGRTPYSSMTDLWASVPLPLSLPFTPRRGIVQALARYAREYCREKGDDDDDDKTGHVLLAMFAILVKHVTGMDVFVIGYRVSLRHARVAKGVAVGPGLTVTVPLRMDLRDLACPLHVFVARVAKEARAADERAQYVSDEALYAQIDRDVAEKQDARELDGDWVQGNAYRPMVVFEYVSHAHAKFLAGHGVGPAVLLEQDPLDALIPPSALQQPSPQPAIQAVGQGDNAASSTDGAASDGSAAPDAATASSPTTPAPAVPEPSNIMSAGDPHLVKEWSSSTDYSYPDLDLTAVEVSPHSDALACRLAYRRGVAPRVAERWMDKLEFLLEGVDVAQRQVTISSLISRFYHSVWMLQTGGRRSGPAPEGAPPGDGTPGSVAELRRSIADQL
ncbi:hypothetical protein H9P43_001043 [Blastocladiella emersonii ATCC 22665]|nr:hypothetical protein H9P43_001043 [Blastocladiella emersonii ATCC 22665]